MIHLLLYGVLLPVVVSTLLAAAVWRPWSPTASPFLRGGYWILPLALALVLPWGAWGVLSGFRYAPPVSANERFIVVGALLGLAGLACSLVDRPRPLATAIYFSAFSAAFAYFVRTRIGSWGVPVTIALAAAFGVFVSAGAGAMATLQQRAAGFWAPLFVVAWLGLLAATLGLSGSAKQAQLVGILAALGGPVMMLAWAKPNAARVRMGWGWLMGVGALMGVGGLVYSNLNNTGALLLAGGALAPLAAQVLPFGSRKWGAVGLGALGLAMGAAAVVSAYVTSPPLDFY